ncbi:hypothetical protein [Kingella potus]|nr:hypothetical protein [Kingella potus]UOP01801.1 hypothetical protein LVJ84_06810 [Kingella potus]
MNAQMRKTARGRLKTAFQTASCLPSHWQPVQGVWRSHARGLGFQTAS